MNKRNEPESSRSGSSEPKRPRLSQHTKSLDPQGRSMISRHSTIPRSSLSSTRSTTGIARTIPDTQIIREAPARSGSNARVAPEAYASTLLDKVEGMVLENETLKKELQSVRAQNTELQLKTLDLEKLLITKESEYTRLEMDYEDLQEASHAVEHVLGSTSHVEYSNESDEHVIAGVGDLFGDADEESEHRNRYVDGAVSEVDEMDSMDQSSSNLRSSRSRSGKARADTETSQLSLDEPNEDDLKVAGRDSIRSLGLCFGNDFEEIVKTGTSLDNEDDSFCEPTSEALELREVRRAAYAKFAHQFPEIHAVLLEKKSDSDAFSQIVKTMEYGAREGRRKDTAKLKSTILEFILQNPQVPPTEGIARLEPPLNGSSKSPRGANHPMIAAILAPSEYIPQLRLGTEQQKKRHAWKCLYVGPSAGLLDPADYPRGGFIDTHEVTTVTIEQIAYSAAHVYFALSTDKRWPDKPGVFNLDTFYRNIVELYHKAPPVWKEDLINFWNQEVLARRTKPGDGQKQPSRLTATKEKPVPRSSSPEKPSDMAKLFEEFNSTR
ncbi:hypothetical protein V5O48_005639 [Marasmius crinis-equi]|uniref:Uncharacterized protein n=1 Tax=Marasmius crinis-equi TaxID=585013 RepID=A0ABR3FMF6_9AGAR